MIRWRGKGPQNELTIQLMIWQRDGRIPMKHAATFSFQKSPGIKVTVMGDLWWLIAWNTAEEWSQQSMERMICTQAVARMIAFLPQMLKWRLQASCSVQSTKPKEIITDHYYVVNCKIHLDYHWCTREKDFIKKK